MEGRCRERGAVLGAEGKRRKGWKQRGRDEGGRKRGPEVTGVETMEGGGRGSWSGTVGRGKERQSSARVRGVTASAGGKYRQTWRDSVMGGWGDG